MGQKSIGVGLEWDDKTGLGVKELCPVEYSPRHGDQFTLQKTEMFERTRECIALHMARKEKSGDCAN